MIRQESIYNPETYQLLEFKEYFNDELIIHEKYDDTGFMYYFISGNNIVTFRKPNLVDKLEIGDLVLYESILHRVIRTSNTNNIFTNDYIIIDINEKLISIEVIKSVGPRDIKIKFKAIKTRIND